MANKRVRTDPRYLKFSALAGGQSYTVTGVGVVVSEANATTLAAAGAAVGVATVVTDSPDVVTPPDSPLTDEQLESLRSTLSGVGDWIDADLNNVPIRYRFRGVDQVDLVLNPGFSDVSIQDATAVTLPSEIVPAYGGAGEFIFAFPLSYDDGSPYGTFAVFSDGATSAYALSPDYPHLYVSGTATWTIDPNGVPVRNPI